jgi:hypothetical protein
MKATTALWIEAGSEKEGRKEEAKPRQEGKVYNYIQVQVQVQLPRQMKKRWAAACLDCWLLVAS